MYPTTKVANNILYIVIYSITKEPTIPKSNIPLDKESYKIGEFDMDELKSTLKKSFSKTVKKSDEKSDESEEEIDVENLPPAREKDPDDKGLIKEEIEEGKKTYYIYFENEKIEGYMTLNELEKIKNIYQSILEGTATKTNVLGGLKELTEQKSSNLNVLKQSIDKMLMIENFPIPNGINEKIMDLAALRLMTQGRPLTEEEKEKVFYYIKYIGITNWIALTQQERKKIELQGRKKYPFISCSIISTTSAPLIPSSSIVLVESWWWNDGGMEIDFSTMFSAPIIPSSLPSSSSIVLME